MEERTLNFNAPFLSTRRFSTTNSALSRRHNEKMKDNSKQNIWQAPQMEQVTEPASVPFTWEQIPGKPKVMDILKHSQEKDIEEQNISRTPADAIKLLSLKVELKEKGVSDSEDEEAYSDALDMLSPKGSFSVIRSISGVSGYDNDETKKPVSVSSDPEARDFMLNRFLPAAKAMTLDKPHYSPKKQQTILASPQPRLIRKIVPAETKLVTQHYHQHLIDEAGSEDVDEDEDEDEDEDGDELSRYVDMPSLSRRGCGLLSRLRFNSSLAMLNPVGGLKVGANSFATSSNNGGKSSKASKLRSHIRSVTKLALGGAYKQKSGSKAVEDNLSCGSDRFRANPTDKLTASAPSSPYRHSGCMSPYRSAPTCSAFRPAGFLGTQKEAENSRANRLNNHIRGIRGINRSQELQLPGTTKFSTISVMERTLYVDTENSTETKAWQKSDSETPSGELLLDEADKIETISPENLKLEDVKSLGSAKLLINEDDAEKTGHGCEVSILAPPLPKMPTESWLLRNLSYPASRNSFSGSSPGSRFHPKQLNADADSNGISRWETIVKTSFLHKDHVRYSEELIPHVCHHQSLT